MNQKNIEKQKKQLLLSIILFMVVAAIFLAFIQQNQRRILKQNSEMIAQTTRENAKSINEIFRYSKSSISMVSFLISQGMESEEINQDVLKSMVEETPFDRIEFTNTKGINTRWDGVTIDVSGRLYYLEGMKGKNGIQVVYDSKISHENLVIFYEPLYYNGKIMGVLLGIITEENLAEQLKNSYAGNLAVAYLCQKDGTVVSATENELIGKNVITHLREKRNVRGKQLKEVEQALILGNAYSFRFRGDKGETNAFIVGLEEEGYSLIKTIPSQVTNAMILEVNRDSILVAAIILVLFLIYFLFIVKDFKESVNKAETTARTFEEVSKSAAISFESIYSIDLKNNYYERIYPDNEEKGDYKKAIERYWQIGRIIDEDGSILRVLSPKSICENLMDKKQIEYKYQRTLKDGQIAWCLTTLIVAERESESDKPAIVTMAIRNINDVVEKDENQKELLTLALKGAQEASEAKMAFLSKMSHDIRTPLNAIIGMTALAKKHIEKPERVQDCLKKIDMSSKHLLSLIDEILDMGKLDAKSMRLNIETFSISEVLEEIILMVKPQLHGKLQVFQSNNRYHHDYVRGDSVQLKKILINVLSNAIKYTPEGGNISFSCTEKENSEGNISTFCFLIEDNGIGMSEEFLERLYDPFERMEDVRISKIQGSGLGLAIVKSVISLMNGDIQVESALGQGSKFTISIPLECVKKEEEELTKRMVEHNDPLGVLQSMDLKGIPVLLVEDNELNREIAMELLEGAGLSPDYAENGLEAVNILEQPDVKEYQLIFMDIQMPVMNGYDATKRIRESRNERIRDLPIIAMTADAFAQDVQKSMNVGMNEHIAKPLDLEKLIFILEKYLTK